MTWLWGTLVGAVPGVLAAVIAWRKLAADQRKYQEAASQREVKSLGDFVAVQTENVIRGWQGVNDELRHRSEEVLVQLAAVTRERDKLVVERDDLRGRVRELELQVAELKTQGSEDRHTITALQRQLASLDRRSNG